MIIMLNVDDVADDVEVSASSHISLPFERQTQKNFFPTPAQHYKSASTNTIALANKTIASPSPSPEDRAVD